MSTQNSIDLRSDTVTQPSPGMRAAIAAAPVGDDVIERDPTAERLQELAAQLLGKEAALFMPSGSMTNQIAVRIHCKPGDEFLCEADCHIFNYEQAAFAQLSGIPAVTVPGDGGVLKREQLEGMIRPENDGMARTRLVTIENTHNCGAGRIQPFDVVEEICTWAHENGLVTHMDGARLFNAVVASGIDAASWSKPFDTVSICLSKGLGAPVGSVLAGSREMIAEARRHRKLFGGGMRQVGMIAAGALYALENNVDRLAEDHAHAQLLAESVRSVDGIGLVNGSADTNIVIFEVDPQFGSAQDFVDRLGARGVQTLAVSGSRVRAVTHLDVNEQQVRRAADAIMRVGEEIAVSALPG